MKYEKKSHDYNPDIGLIQITFLAKHFRKKNPAK